MAAVAWTTIPPKAILPATAATPIAVVVVVVATSIVPPPATATAARPPVATVSAPIATIPAVNAIANPIFFQNSPSLSKRIIGLLSQ